jgi:hypothetical protein
MGGNGTSVQRIDFEVPVSLAMMNRPRLCFYRRLTVYRKPAPPEHRFKGCFRSLSLNG